jgi:hypothetical protein
MVEGRTETFLVEELSINDFAKYWTKVRQAFYYISGTDREVLDAWIEVPVFQKLCIECLELLGIQNPTHELTVSQVAAILFYINWDEKEGFFAGAASQLHTDGVPKPLAPSDPPEEGEQLKAEEPSETNIEAVESMPVGKSSLLSNLVLSIRSTLLLSGLASIAMIGLPLLYFELQHYPAMRS